MHEAHFSVGTDSRPEAVGGFETDHEVGIVHHRVTIREVPYEPGKEEQQGYGESGSQAPAEAAGAAAKSVKRTAKAAKREAVGVIRAISETVAEGAEAATKAGAKLVQGVKETLSPTRVEVRESAGSSKTKSSSVKTKSATKTSAPKAKAAPRSRRWHRRPRPPRRRPPSRRRPRQSLRGGCDESLEAQEVALMGIDHSGGPADRRRVLAGPSVPRYVEVNHGS